MNINEIIISFTYQGHQVEFVANGHDDLIHNDDFVYCLFEDKTGPHDEYEDPYFEVNFKTRWNEKTSSYDIMPSGYVNHFKDTCETTHDWQTDDVQIDFIYG